ncbi:hypothetical protein LINGRAHAP2_LOCUS33852 [Linum grandiflorum]
MDMKNSMKFAFLAVLLIVFAINTVSGEESHSIGVDPPPANQGVRSRISKELDGRVINREVPCKFCESPCTCVRDTCMCSGQ